MEMLSQIDVSQIEQNIFENYNTSHGLPNDVVYGFLKMMMAISSLVRAMGLQFSKAD
jgi:hypothetical protein